MLYGHYEIDELTSKTISQMASTKAHNGFQPKEEAIRQLYLRNERFANRVDDLTHGDETLDFKAETQKILRKYQEEIEIIEQAFTYSPEYSEEISQQEQAALIQGGNGSFAIRMYVDMPKINNYDEVLFIFDKDKVHVGDIREDKEKAEPLTLMGDTQNPILKDFSEQFDNIKNYSFMEKFDGDITKLTPQTLNEIKMMAAQDLAHKTTALVKENTDRANQKLKESKELGMPQQEDKTH